MVDLEDLEYLLMVVENASFDCGRYASSAEQSVLDELAAKGDAYRVSILSELTALRAENAKLRTGLDSMLRIFREETSSGDGIQEGHVAVYEAARAALDAKEG